VLDPLRRSVADDGGAPLLILSHAYADSCSQLSGRTGQNIASSSVRRRWRRGVRFAAQGEERARERPCGVGERDTMAVCIALPLLLSSDQVTPQPFADTLSYSRTAARAIDETARGVSNHLANALSRPTCSGGSAPH
jgi:hypothetical protein